MCRQAYQKGPTVDVFGPTGTKPCKLWQLKGQVSRNYDKSSCGLAIKLAGTTSTKMTLPSNSRSSLFLTQRYLIVQAHCSAAKPCSFELVVTTADNSTTRRRIVFSSSFMNGGKKMTPLNAQHPLDVEGKLVSLNQLEDDAEVSVTFHNISQNVSQHFTERFTPLPTNHYQPTKPHN